MSIHPVREKDKGVGIVLDNSIVEKERVLIVPFRSKQFFDKLRSAKNPMLYNIRKNKKEWEIFGNRVRLFI